MSINDKIDENIRQLKRKLILYETDHNRLRTEIPNTVSDKRIRAELAVVGLERKKDFQLIENTF